MMVVLGRNSCLEEIMSVPPQQPHHPQAYAPSGSDRAMAVLAHLAAPIAALVSLGSLSLLGPLLVWFVYRDKSPSVRYAAAGAFNFNLSFWLLYVLSWILIVTVVGALVGIPLLIVILVVSLVCHIKGALRANRSEPYTYPFQIKVLS